MDVFFVSISITSLPSTHDKLEPQWLLAAHRVAKHQRERKRNCQEARSRQLPFPSDGYHSRASVTLLSPSSLLTSVISNSTVSLYSSSSILFLSAHSLIPLLPFSSSLERLLSLRPCSDLVSCNHIYSDCGYVRLRPTAGIRTRLKCISSDYSRSHFTFQLALQLHVNI